MDKQWVLNCVEFIKKIEKNNYSWILSDEAKNDNSAKLSCVSLFCKLAKMDLIEDEDISNPAFFSIVSDPDGEPVSK